jgi:hypothetical protein
MSLTAVRLPGWPKRTGLRCLAQVEGLAGEGRGCGIVDPGGLAAVVGNLPALTDQGASAAVDAVLPGPLRLQR